MNNIRAGAKIPLFVLIPSNFSEPEVTAAVISLTPFEVLHENISLTEVPDADTCYINEDIVMPDKPFVHVIYRVTEVGEEPYTLQERFGLERVQQAPGEELVAIIMETESLTAEVTN